MDDQDQELEQQLESANQETQRRMEELLEMADQELAKLLMKRMLVTLIGNIESGLATASDLNVARAFLKDNNIGIVPTRDNAAGILAQRLEDHSNHAKKTAGVIDPEKLSEVDISDFVERVN